MIKYLMRITVVVYVHLLKTLHHPKHIKEILIVLTLDHCNKFQGLKDAKFNRISMVTFFSIYYVY